MAKKIISIFIGIMAWLSLMPVYGQQADSLFREANRLYRQQKYAEALDAYRRVEALDSVSPELYFNMGNAASKMNKKALSIYYYKKALRLRPGYTQARDNLQWMERSLLDRIQPAPVPFYQKLWNKWTGLWSVYVWGLLSLIFAWLAFAWGLAYLLSAKPGWKRLFFVLTWIFIFLWGISFASFRSAQAQYLKPEGIIAVEQTSLYAEPGFDSPSAGELHEGTSIDILENRGEWLKARTADGQIFWIPRNNVLIIGQQPPVQSH